MKMLSIIIRPDRLEKLKEILNKNSTGGLTVINAMGCGNQRGRSDSDSSTEELRILNMNLIPKVMAVTVVKDEDVNTILAEITTNISSGKVGDGKVFVTDVLDSMRIRTGDRGEKAL